jgi:hypothetical protein
VAVMLTISSIRLAQVILVFRAAHLLAAGKSSRRRLGPDRSQPGGVERGMRPLLNAGHDPAEYVAIARALGVDPYEFLAHAKNEVGGWPPSDRFDALIPPRGRPESTDCVEELAQPSRWLTIIPV